MACSLATRIALYEAGAAAQFTCVDTRSKRTLAGDDYWQVTPMGQVPALRTNDGLLLTENAAVLQQQLSLHPHLVGDFSVADAYLTAVLNWAPYAGVDLAPWPGRCSNAAAA